MPTIVERDGRFLVRVRKKGFRPVAKTFTRKSDAVTWGRRVEADMVMGRWVDEGEQVPTLYDALNEYLQCVVPTFKSRAGHKATFNSLREQTRPDLPVNKVTPAHLARWRDSLVRSGLKSGSVVRYLGMVGGFFGWCWKDRGWLTSNPMAGVRKPVSNDARDRVLTREEADYLLRGAKAGCVQVTRYLPDALTVALETAIRRSELWALTVADVNPAQAVLYVRDGKTGARVTPCSPLALEALKRLSEAATARADKLRQAGCEGVPPAGAERLIPTVEARALTGAFHGALKRARILYAADCEGGGVAPEPGFLEGVRFHDLRHTAVTGWAQAGLSVHELQMVSGHKTITMLSRYVNLKATSVAHKLAKLTNKAA